MVQQNSNQQCEGRQEGVKPLANALKSLIFVIFQLSSKPVAKKSLYGFKLITPQERRDSQFQFQTE